MTAFARHDAAHWRCDGCGLEAVVATVPFSDFWHLQQTPEGPRHHCPNCADELGLVDEPAVEPRVGVNPFGP